MTWDALEKAGADLLRRLGPSALRTVLDHALDRWPRDAILRATPGAETLLDALEGVDRSAGLPYLTGLAAGYAQRAGEVSVETVWSGPASHHVPVRARSEFELSQDEIIAAIRAGKLQYRPSSMHGNPWLRLLRRVVEDLVRTRHGERYLRARQPRTELKLGERAFEIVLTRRMKNDGLETQWFARHRMSVASAQRERCGEARSARSWSATVSS